MLQPSGRSQRRTAGIAPWHSRRFVGTSENYHTGQLNERVTVVKSRLHSLSLDLAHTVYLWGGVLGVHVDFQRDPFEADGGGD